MAENDVNRLIDMLYERVEDAKSPALKPNLSMVDRDEVLDLLDELRNQLPVSGYAGQHFPAFYFCIGSVLLGETVWKTSYGTGGSRNLF